MLKVKNNTRELEKALNLDEGSVKHFGNFIFEGTLNGHRVRILVRPEEKNHNILEVYALEL